MTNDDPEILYKITISEIQYDDFEAATLLYMQIVERVDIKAVMDAVNSSSAKKPRAARSDKGKKRIEPPLTMPTA